MYECGTFLLVKLAMANTGLKPVIVKQVVFSLYFNQSINLILEVIQRSQKLSNYPDLII